MPFLPFPLHWRDPNKASSVAPFSMLHRGTLVPAGSGPPLVPVDPGLPFRSLRNLSDVPGRGGGSGDGESDPLQPPRRRRAHDGQLQLLLSEPGLAKPKGASKRYLTTLRRLQQLLDNETHHLKRPSSAVALPSAQLSANRKLAWFHVPKCSTSIGATFGYYLKPELQDDAGMPACSDDDPCPLSSDGIPEVQFMKKYMLPKDLMWAKNGNWGDHNAIDADTWQKFRGHFVGLFRDPVRRAISSYKWFGEPIGQDLLGYANSIRGTTVRMMTGQRYGLDCNWPRFPCDSGVTQEPADVDKAIERLAGFKYVGMTDEYPLSVCLFHAMFGGECRPSEFGNMRQTSKLKHADGLDMRDELSGAGPLAGLVDEEETTFFMATYDRFCTDLREWRVTQQYCKQVICPRASEHFEDVAVGGKHCSDDRRPHLEAFLRQSRPAPNRTEPVPAVPEGYGQTLGD